MRVPIRDVLGTVVVASIVVPYVGFLVGGSMPFIHDTRAMAATAFILWVAVFLIADQYDTTTSDGTTELVLFAIAVVLGGAAVLAAEMLAALAPVLLAGFVGMAVVTWTLRLLRNTGRWHHGTLAAR
jgi:hypothetical protein